MLPPPPGLLGLARKPWICSKEKRWFVTRLPPCFQPIVTSSCGPATMYLQSTHRDAAAQSTCRRQHACMEHTPAKMLSSWRELIINISRHCFVEPRRVPWCEVVAVWHRTWEVSDYWATTVPHSDVTENCGACWEGADGCIFHKIRFVR